MKIDKDRPVPKAKGQLIPTVQKMEIGDSVFFKGPEGKKRYHSLYTAAWRKKIKLRGRPEADGYRVWRVS